MAKNINGRTSFQRKFTVESIGSKEGFPEGEDENAKESS